jgi:small-conductance mechanosensitive channel
LKLSLKKSRTILYQDIFSAIFDWFFLNFFPIVISAGAIIFGYLINIIIKRQLSKMVKNGKMDRNVATNIATLLKYIIYLIIITIILMQFAQSLGLVTALITIMGGTVIGFASMSTVGNMIAGIIIMVSRPFSVGDRVIFNDQIADIIEIKLIYTIMIDLDKIKISVPNQQLMNSEIIDLGKDKIIRRHVSITPSFKEDRLKIENALLEVPKIVPQILDDPKPYVWMTEFQNYAVQYTLYVFISDIMNLPYIDSELHKAVFDMCKKHGIDIRTPLLLENI